MQATLTKPDTKVVHGIITIRDNVVEFDISHGKGSGSNPYGGKDRKVPYRVETVIQTIFKLFERREVETTEVHDERTKLCEQCGKPTENLESWCSQECYEDGREN